RDRPRWRNIVLKRSSTAGAIFLTIKFLRPDGIADWQRENVLTKSNFDPVTIASFGDEWSRHRQENLTSAELEKMFDDYFHIVPWSQLPPGAQTFDMGTGTGRRARLAAPRVGELHVI